MSTAKYIGRVGALAVTLGVGIALATAPGVAFAEQSSPTSSDSTALMVCGTTCPTWHDADVERIMNQFITPTHPGQTIAPVAVTAPGEAWPLTGLLRLAGFAVGDPSFFGPDGAAWPDEPWWKLSGLFDLTTDQSIQAGVADLEQAMAAHGNDHLMIYGYSQGALVANAEKRKLAEQYPAGTAAPDIDFVLGGDFHVPNGGLYARFPGLYIPVLDWTLNGPAQTDTQFDTVEINRQYDGVADFPLYPLNLVATANALLGFLYVHTYPFDVSLPEDPTTSPAYQGTHGDTSYYFFETQDLPLFAPLRMLGVPESLIDVVEPFFRVIVELGYDRTIPPWEPTPARLIPPLNPVTVTTDLVAAIGEGIDNALAPIGSPSPVSVPAPVTLAAPAVETEQAMSAGATIDTRQMSTDTATSTTTVTETDPSTSAQDVIDTEPPTSPNVTETIEATKSRSVVRDSLGVDQQLPDRSERGEGDEPITRAAAAGAEDATGEASSAASSSAASSTAGSSSAGSSSGNDGDGS